MTFRVRSLPEILDSQLATIVANSEIDDTNVGSAARTVAEAASIQDADQYLQIARLKQAFSRRKARGEDLDERGADFGIERLSPTQATVLVKFGDSNVSTKVASTMGVSAVIGNTTVTLADGAAFPEAGSLVFERDTPGQRELRPYSAKVGNVFTLTSALTINHSAGTDVTLSTAGSDRIIASGTTVSVPETTDVQQLDYLTVAAATLRDGEVYSDEVSAVSVGTGAIYNVGTSQLSLIGAPPFQTATVTNDTPALGGQDEERDEDYANRLGEAIQSLSSATPSNLLSAALAVSLPTGERVITAQVVEEFADPDVSVYIDDGTGTVTTTESKTSMELLIHRAETGQRRATLIDWPVVSGTLSLKKSDLRGEVDSVAPGVGSAVCTDASAGFTPGALVGRIVIDDNRNSFVITANTANDFTVTVTTVNPVIGPYAILQTGFLTLSTDYLFNETTGDIELVSPLTQYDCLAAYPNPSVAYTFYTGLIRETQRVLKGDPLDLDNYPGEAATGVKLKVRAPTVQNISFNILVISSLGTIEADLTVAVKDAVQSYVNGLGVGQDVILAEIIAAVMAVDGVTDVRITSPAANVIVLDGVLPRTRASLITVL